MRCALVGKMKELQLQPRLQRLADLVPQGARLADIGTDHGYLPVWLIQHGCISDVIAADIAQEPLDHAKQTAAQYEIDSISFRLCDGLAGIAPTEVDYIIIAGMGGDTIVSILSSAPWTKNGIKLLLQPMTKVEMLRSWLVDNGYCFTRESLVWDKDFLYPMMEIAGGTQRKLTAAEAWAGTKLNNDPLYGEYLTHQLSRLQKAVDGLKKANDARSHDRARELEKICKALEEKRSAL